MMRPAFNRCADPAASLLADAERYLAADGFERQDDSLRSGARLFRRTDENGADAGKVMLFLPSLGAPASMGGLMVFSHEGKVADCPTVADYVREKKLAEIRNPVLRFLTGLVM